jgi:hypothetical protein
MTARAIGQLSPGYVFITFDGYELKRRYVVKGTNIIRWPGPDFGTPSSTTFELVRVDDQLEKALLDLAERLGVPGELTFERGFVVRLIGVDRESEPVGFEIEVSDYTEVTPQ